MNWNIEHRLSAGADRISASWAGFGTVYDVRLASGPGVHKSSFGGSTRGEMTAYSSEVAGVFRAAEGVDQPGVSIYWRETPDGDEQSQAIALRL